MNTLSRTITGTLAIILGLGLIITGFFISPIFPFLFYGIPVLIIGIFILLNKKEDDIETIKNQRFFGSQKSKKISAKIKSKGG